MMDCRRRWKSRTDGCLCFVGWSTDCLGVLTNLSSSCFFSLGGWRWIACGFERCRSQADVWMGAFWGCRSGTWYLAKWSLFWAQLVHNSGERCAYQDVNGHKSGTNLLVFVECGGSFFTFFMEWRDRKSGVMSMTYQSLSLFPIGALFAFLCLHGPAKAPDLALRLCLSPFDFPQLSRHIRFSFRYIGRQTQQEFQRLAWWEVTICP